MHTTRLSFTKYVSRMDAAFLIEYIGLLPNLHPDCEILTPYNSRRPLPTEEAVAEILGRLNESRAPFKGFIRSHWADARAVCGGLDWHLMFERFAVEAGTHYGFPGSPFPGEEGFAADCAEPWIASGLCDGAHSLGSLPQGRDNAWTVYLGIKNEHRYEPRSNYDNSLLDFWGEYPDDGASGPVCCWKRCARSWLPSTPACSPRRCLTISSASTSGRRPPTSRLSARPTPI